MSDKEKDLIKRIAKTIPSLNSSEQNYILGVADGLALAKEKEMVSCIEDVEQPVE